jgi:hypothetical protein
MDEDVHPLTEMARALFRDGLTQRARLLFYEELSPDTKPTETQARAAALGVLGMIQGELPDADEPAVKELKLFLLELAYAICPWVKSEALNLIHTRRVDFIYTDTGTKSASAAFNKRLDVAREVHLLTKAGQYGVKIVADREHRGVQTQTSRDCNKPEVKKIIEQCYGQITSSEAVEVLGRLYGRAQKPARQRPR